MDQQQHAKYLSNYSDEISSHKEYIEKLNGTPYRLTHFRREWCNINQSDTHEILWAYFENDKKDQKQLLVDTTQIVGGYQCRLGYL